jgi:hypothetical protein
MSVVLSDRDINFSFKPDIPFYFLCFVIIYFKDWPLCDNTVNMKAMTLCQYHLWETEVSSTLTVKVMVFWDVISCHWINVYWCLRATWCLCHMGGSMCTFCQCTLPESCSLQYHWVYILTTSLHPYNLFTSLQPVSQHLLFFHFFLSTYDCF